MTVHHDDAHRECLERIPWLVAGTLGSAESEAVRRHAEGCESCRRELAASRELASWITREAASAPLAHPARLARLRLRLDQAGTGPDAGRGARARLQELVRRTPAPVRWLVAVQAIVLLGVAIVGITTADSRVDPTGPTTYRTLAAPAPSGSSRQARVVFAPGTTESEIRALLLGLRARLIGGPSPLGAYTLAFEPTPVGLPEDAELGLLRSHPRVLLAEPVGAPDARRP